MIRVFIGTEPAQWLPTEVLKHSILRRSKEQFEFKELKNIPLNLHIKMYTGFSFYRFSIPEECQFEGRAIYLDADIVVLCDLNELNAMEMQGHGALSRPHPNNKGYFTSVILMDCDKLKHWKIHQWVTLINAGIASYDMTMAAMPSGLSHKDFGPFESKWNDLDHWDEKTKIIHYTHVPTQPWKVPGHPFAFVFLREMKSALDSKVITPADVQREIDAGHIYPTILQDAQNIS
jgi:hypothetical protein